MSDYIPTTEEMREYVNAGWKFKGDFDRWLEQNNAEVIKATEERIIKLLEEEMERIRLMDGYPATNALANIRGPLIKADGKKGNETVSLLTDGESKTNPWTSRPLTEEDIEHYGLEGENK